MRGGSVVDERVVDQPHGGADAPMFVKLSWVGSVIGVSDGWSRVWISRAR
jgi:hypothetical protein